MRTNEMDDEKWSEINPQPKSRKQFPQGGGRRLIDNLKWRRLSANQRTDVLGSKTNPIERYKLFKIS